MKTANLFAAHAALGEDELLQTLVKHKHVTIERIVSQGHTSPDSGWYDQVQHEWVMVVKGRAILSFEGGDDVQLEEGGHIIIPAHQKHKVSWTDPNQETVWLAVHYS